METSEKAQQPKLTPKGRKLRAQWITALESGNYKQGRDYLRQRNVKGRLEYCCLGVLCNLTGTQKWERDRSWGDREAYSYADGTDGRPPENISKLVGLETKQIDILVELNDQYHLSFKEIADRLRNNDFSYPAPEEEPSSASVG